MKSRLPSTRQSWDTSRHRSGVVHAHAGRLCARRGGEVVAARAPLSTHYKYCVALHRRPSPGAAQGRKIRYQRKPEGWSLTTKGPTMTADLIRRIRAYQRGESQEITRILIDDIAALQAPAEGMGLTDEQANALAAFYDVSPGTVHDIYALSKPKAASDAQGDAGWHGSG